jgi:hypothetical protein
MIFEESDKVCCTLLHGSGGIYLCIPRVFITDNSEYFLRASNSRDYHLQDTQNLALEARLVRGHRVILTLLAAFRVDEVRYSPLCVSSRDTREKRITDINASADKTVRGLPDNIALIIHRTVTRDQVLSCTTCCQSCIIALVEVIR